MGVLKTGNIATSLVVELMLDERADRELEVDVFSTGAKMGRDDAERLLSMVRLDEYPLLVYVTPNPATPGPKRVIEALAGRRAVVVGDAPGMKLRERLEELGLGYIFVKGDAMIGARREFLDPMEMVLFNADMLRVLAVSGALRVVQEELDRAIEAAERGDSYLPRVVVDAERAAEAAGFSNPYAKARAMAAYRGGSLVAELNTSACFAMKEMERYVPTCAAAHELLRYLAVMCDEALEMEKAQDSLLRTPHAKDGRRLSKRRLMEKPG